MAENACHRHRCFLHGEVIVQAATRPRTEGQITHPEVFILDEPAHCQWQRRVGRSRSRRIHLQEQDRLPCLAAIQETTPVTKQGVDETADFAHSVRDLKGWLSKPPRRPSQTPVPISAKRRLAPRRMVDYASKLRRQDSNLNYQNQNLMCCRLHHDGLRTSGEQVCSPAVGHDGRPHNLMSACDSSATRYPGTRGSAG
jgi:hypothetical protein